MHHTKKGIIGCILFILSQTSFGNDSIEFKQCIKQLGGSASLGSLCYTKEARRYKEKSDTIYKKLITKIPKKEKNYLISYRNSIKNQLKICELKYLAYDGWEKNINPVHTVVILPLLVTFKSREL